VFNLFVIKLSQFYIYKTVGTLQEYKWSKTFKLNKQNKKECKLFKFTIPNSLKTTLSLSSKFHTVWSCMRYLRSKLSSLHHNVTDYTVALSYHPSRHVSLILDNQRDPEASWRPVADYRTRERQMESLRENPAKHIVPTRIDFYQWETRWDSGEHVDWTRPILRPNFDLSETRLSFGKLVQKYIGCPVLVWRHHSITCGKSGILHALNADKVLITDHILLYI